MELWTSHCPLLWNNPSADGLHVCDLYHNKMQAPDDDLFLSRPFWFAESLGVRLFYTGQSPLQTRKGNQEGINAWQAFGWDWVAGLVPPGVINSREAVPLRRCDGWQGHPK